MSAPSIPPGPEGERIRMAFARFGLDPSNPDHWFTLLDSYIEGSRRPPGAPRKWTPVELNHLLGDVTMMEIKLRHAPVKPSRDTIFRKLARTKAYRNFSWKTLKTNYYRALMPEHNSMLAAVLDALAREYETEDGSSSRERLLAWWKTGVTDAFLDEAGNVVRLVPRGLRPRRK